MNYLVVSTAVSDDISFPDGRVKKQLAGGAGIYALAGIKVWADEVEIVSGVGSDYLSLHSEWFTKNNLTVKGLTIRGEFTPRTLIQYFADGEREETSAYGLEHYRTMEATPEDVEHECQDTKGVYVFKNSDPDFWAKMIAVRNRYGFKLLWEISADAAIPENLEGIGAICREIDIFSINRQEAFHLFASSQVDEITPRLRAFGLPLVFLRLGDKGAAMITPSGTCQIPSVQLGEVVDTTGGGNSSSSAVLFGYCEGKGPLLSGIMGSISAAYCIRQFGPPQLLNADLRGNALRIAEEEYKKANSISGSFAS